MNLKMVIRQNPLTYMHAYIQTNAEKKRSYIITYTHTYIYIYQACCNLTSSKLMNCAIFFTSISKQNTKEKLKTIN